MSSPGGRCYIESVFKISNEQELKECFRPLDREEVIVPQDFHYPAIVKDYLTWVEPSGYRVYLVFSDRLGAPPLGIVFRRDQSAGTAAAMCEWCHSVRTGDGVSVLSANSSSRKRVGLHLCRDLSCKEKAESEPGVHDFPISQSPQEKIKRIIGKMAAFARREIF